MIRVALDAMGGDLGPRIVFEGAIHALSLYEDVEISIYKHRHVHFSAACHPRLKCIDCDDFIAAGDIVERSLFQRRQATLHQVLLALRATHADVAITLGNTGVMVALARHVLGLLKPKLYPALIRELHAKPRRCLVDLGANVHCPAAMLQNFACLGAAYIEAFGDEKAKVGLLNVGVEASKGSSVIQQANTLLQSEVWPEFCGYVEGHEIFQGNKNVIVCDGMVGNAVLKAAEGLLAYLMSSLDSIADRRVIETFFQNERRHGACLVGVRGNLVKGHGGSDVQAMIGAIGYGIDIARVNLYDKVAKRLHEERIV